MARFVGSSTPLAGNATWSDILLPMGADRVTGSVFSDQSGTLFIEQAGDLKWADVTAGTSLTANWDISAQYAYTGGDGKGFSEYVELPFVRVRFLNGATPQTVFRIRGQVQSAGGK